ncbi:MAG: hypothetical protein CMM15_07450 [Rhodospirillaceae bacterium]|nr:hypothetical protein [Rhodospirillaceae bacterium]|tara:strand:- start:1931 stop:2254 length:324 start_codon:yes stop_codon:yes gene_type:complete
MTRTRANISRRDNKKTPAVHPTPPSNQSSAFASVLGGMASGFGFGSGIEAAKGIGNSLFHEEKRIPASEEHSCQLLADVLHQCNGQEINLNDCSHLLQVFAEKCLPK